MGSIHLEDVGHSYVKDAPVEQWALKPLTMTFQAGRTYALVGPSGCGKTTMLNIISGIVAPSQGKVLFDDRDVTGLPTARRNVAQVFQFPTIYRSMDVYQNLAFPLVCRDWPKDRIDERVRIVADALGLAGRLNRAAARLTVDEKQLVSLGRGLVRDSVSVLLMDEPLTVIDPHFKAELRRKIREANDQLGSTIIYVTHDQYEAMTFAEEILVMNMGEVVQQGTPEELFERPRTRYVGYFVGSPAMNFIDAQVRDGVAYVGNTPIAFAGGPRGVRDGRVELGIRPEYVSIGQTSTGNHCPAEVTSIQDMGGTYVLTCDVQGQKVQVKVPRAQELPQGSSVMLSLPADKCLPYVDGQLAVA